ncbi:MULTISPECIES: DUF222 domain-containing protein [unclassified Nocardioides]|uniref:DUF222 domain-containing protein n=1 Tax=unclassified Nocardioides TaxID=2615069 RepID=UPI00361E10C0
MTAIATPRHRVSAAVAHVRAELDASNAGNWLAHQTRSTRPAAHATVRFGHALEQHPLTRDALAAGQVLAEQARVIVRWVDKLPDTLGADVLEKAERHLLEQARDHDARDLNNLGRHLYEVIAPEQADAHEARLLAEEEAAAAQACELTLRDDDRGRTRGTFTVPRFHGAALRKALMAIMAPKHQAATRGAGVERRPAPQAMGQAFCEYTARYPVKRLPRTGGINATLLVLIDEDSLTGRLEKAGALDTGDKISPGMARRLACEAGIIPVVLGRDSVPLDLGRKRRTFTDHQRLAMFVQYRGCAAEACDHTTGLHAHQTTPWAHGGLTNLEDGKPNCPYHHGLAHHPDYQTTHLPHGKVRFHRRT